jgi:SAM-dependent methyltransferase
MTPYGSNVWAWQESWDRQQEAYLPDREERFAAMLDAVEAVAGAAPRILDLAGGTGSISLRALRRFPQATTTLVDVDPVLLAIARDSLDDRTAIVPTDLRSSDWVATLPHDGYDAVLTATALHWLPELRLTALYAEIRGALRPGGVFVNADHMVDDGLPALSEKLLDLERERRDARYAAGAVLSWEAWWDHVAKDPTYGPLIERRKEIFANRGHTESTPPVSWHVDALRAAGFAEAGIVWRGATDAAVTGVR